MVIYMQHPQHGSKVAISEAEAIYDETSGWVRFQPDSNVAPSVAPAASQNVEEPAPSGEPVRADIEAAYKARFGKTPHWKKSTATLIKELA